MKKILLPFYLLMALHTQLYAQTRNPLPRSKPETEGVSSRAISDFLDSLARSKHEFHSFMFLRHGKVIAEAWWNPYRADLKHSLYSLSKSFTATAVGFANAAGKLSMDDKVISFFPDRLPDSISPNLRQLKVKDLITMSAGQEPDPTSAIVQDTNWVKKFLSLPVKYQPGSRFLYNSMATYMLSAIVQKATGQKVFDYLQPRLFEPLGIVDIDWETDLKGTNTGGWGLRLKTEDIAKFTQLFLQKGVWNGKQLLPIGWVEQASSAHIIQHPDYSQTKRDSSDWEQGYGYQMWRCRNNAFRGDGAFGQYAIVMPDQDAVIAITSETPDMQGELNLIWKVLLPGIKKSALPTGGTDYILLEKKLAALALPVKNDPIAPVQVSGKPFILEVNPQHIQSLAFHYGNGNVCELEVKTDTAAYSIQFGRNNWQTGKTSMRGPYLLAAATNNLAGLSPFQIAGEYTWLDANTLELVLRYIESPHSQRMICHFENNALTVEMKRSFSFDAPGSMIVLKGKSQ